MGLSYGSLCFAYVFLIYSLSCYVLCIEYPGRLLLWVLSLLFTVICCLWCWQLRYFYAVHFILVVVIPLGVVSPKACTGNLIRA
jgi:hypothetical protein